MELVEAIESVRAVRQFRDQKPDVGTITSLIEAAIAAPTASNRQGWRFIFIDDTALMKRFVDMGASSTILKAPVGLLVLYDNRTSNTAYFDHHQSAAASIQNILLRAQELGLGCCWICRLPKRSRLKRLLRIPWSYDPIAYIALGYPEGDGKKKGNRKYTPSQVLAANRFDFPDVETDWLLRLKWSLQLHRKRLIRWFYFNGTDGIRRRLETWL